MISRDRIFYLTGNFVPYEIKRSAGCKMSGGYLFCVDRWNVN